MSSHVARREGEETTRTLHYRGYCSKTVLTTLAECMELHRELYNACITERRSAWKMAGISVSYLDQQNQLPEIKRLRPELIPLGSHALQETCRRVERGYQAAFRRIRERKPTSFPRYQSRRRFRSFGYPDPAGWSWDRGHALHVSHLGDIRLHGKSRVMGRPVALRLKLRDDATLDVTITVACALPKRESGAKLAGLDLGLFHAIALSDGSIYDASKPLKAALKRLQHEQRSLSRKRRGSKNREKQRRLVARLHEKVANQRKDWVHKVTAKLASEYTLVVTEDLSITNLTRNGGSHKRGLNRSFSDVAPGMIDQFLSYKLAEAGGVYRNDVDPRRYKPSQTCPRCLHVRKKTLAQRTHRCAACEYVVDRDVAAGQVCLLVYQQHYPTELQGRDAPGVEDAQRSGRPGRRPVPAVNDGRRREARNRQLAA